MTTTTKTDFFKVERKDTDKSLNAERERTNQSLSTTRAQTENETDAFVKNERLETDQARSNIRNEADAERDSQRSQNSPNTERAFEQKTNDNRLSLERRDADLAIQRERLVIDSALGEVRKLEKSRLEDVLSQERGSTDLNLSNERLRTDTEVLLSAGRLSSEIASHLKTKVCLTSRDEFLAIVSHDLRNPIGAIATCTDLILDDHLASLSPEIKQFIVMIQRNAKTGLRLIEDILDMESVAMGQFQLQLKDVCIGEIFTEVRENFLAIANEKLIDLQIIDKNLAAEFIGDKERVKQIITNLVANGLKFTPTHGFVRLEVKVKDSTIEIGIHDSGPGIPESKKNKIFERFAQLGQNDRRGLGLGLYISKMLAEAHHGYLWVESEFGHGSSFYVSLPGLKHNHF